MSVYETDITSYSYTNTTLTVNKTPVLRESANVHNAHNFTTVDINAMLERTEIENKIMKLLREFSENCSDIQFKKGFYIYGAPGCGKTQFVMNLLKKMDYDIIKYDAGDVRNKMMINTITSNNVTNCNVLNLMKGKIQKIAIVMDEIDGMNGGDKGGISSLIKLIRQKKTKKQRQENTTNNPIICIGNYFIDKKIKELMKVCHVFELKLPTTQQVSKLVGMFMPNIKNRPLLSEIHNYIQSDMRKIAFLHNVYRKNESLITINMIRNIFHTKSYNEDSKQIIQKLFVHPINIEEHATFMNETDRTTVALLWHENIIDKIDKLPREIAFPFYLKILKNICYSDYIDRITFQSQIWIFNEMSSLIKTFYNNTLYHRLIQTPTHPPISNLAISADNVRFTKVLTKYSTEYNNLMFVFMLCQELDMDRSDMVTFFQELRAFYGKDLYNKTEVLNDASKIFIDQKISKLDIKRVYRYLDKNVKRDITNLEDGEESEDGNDEYE
jgi:DNA polymerase III delta prime subunit